MALHPILGVTIKITSETQRVSSTLTKVLRDVNTSMAYLDMCYSSILLRKVNPMNVEKNMLLTA